MSISFPKALLLVGSIVAVGSLHEWQMSRQLSHNYSPAPTPRLISEDREPNMGERGTMRKLAVGCSSEKELSMLRQVGQIDSSFFLATLSRRFDRGVCTVVPGETKVVVTDVGTGRDVCVQPADGGPCLWTPRSGIKATHTRAY